MAERIAATERASVACALERRIEKLEGERIALFRRLAPVAEEELRQAAQSAGTAFLAVRGVLKSPYQSWKSGDAVRRRLIGGLVFDALPAFDRKDGFGTVNLSLPYRVSRTLMDNESRLVDQAGKNLNNGDATDSLPIDWEELGRHLVQFAQAFSALQQDR